MKNPLRKATLESEMAEAIQNLKPTALTEYAPPQHVDRISASAQIMCDGIDKLFASASEENQKIVDQAEIALNEMKKFKDMVDDGMRRSADGLKKHLCHVMALLEDGTAKMLLKHDQLSDKIGWSSRQIYQLETGNAHPTVWRRYKCACWGLHALVYGWQKGRIFEWRL